MLILGAVGLQIRLSDCSTFNVPLDLWSLAKQECFCRKDTTNETLQSDFPFFSFDSFFSPLIVHRLFFRLIINGLLCKEILPSDSHHCYFSL